MSISLYPTHITRKSFKRWLIYVALMAAFGFGMSSFTAQAQNVVPGDDDRHDFSVPLLTADKLITSNGLPGNEMGTAADIDGNYAAVASGDGQIYI